MTSLQPTVVVDRPPPGPARGKWEASPWLFVVFAVIAILAAGAYWAWRLRRSRKAGP